MEKIRKISSKEKERRIRELKEIIFEIRRDPATHSQIKKISVEC